MLLTPFSLLDAPPLQALFMCSSAQQPSRLLIVVDHVASDHAATLTMQKELRTILHAFVQKAHPTVPSLSLQYADFSLWQRRHKPEDAQTVLEWWRFKLDGIPQLLRLPLERPRVPMHEALCKRRPMRLHFNAAA